MERGSVLKTKPEIEFLVKSKRPSGQSELDEDHYDIICSKGSLRISATLLNLIFEEVKEEVKEEKQETKQKHIKTYKKPKVKKVK